MIDKTEEKDLGRLITFKVSPYDCRVSADCGDIYNWLLDYDKKLAQLFYIKYTDILKLLPNYKNDK